VAEQTASNVRGVKQIVNTLRTMTGEWLQQEERINDTLPLNDLHDVSVRVIGSQAYLSGQVSSQADNDRAVEVVSSQSKLQIANFIRVVPGPVFLSANFF
jgi:osmotically-inducible protein OsmY